MEESGGASVRADKDQNMKKLSGSLILASREATEVNLSATKKRKTLMGKKTEEVEKW